jgi:hypothetical protein
MAKDRKGILPSDNIENEKNSFLQSRFYFKPQPVDVSSVQL